MKTTKSGENTAAARYGFARIGLSTPDGYWTFGNDNVVNDQKPMPCSESDSKDIPYLKMVFKFIEDNSDMFDTNRIYTEGFSQNSMFSAYIAFCFSDKVHGVWQGGSGMALTGRAPNLPGCQGQCKASVYAELSNCNQCINQQPCTECQYWPIYPCYNEKKAMIDCLADYTNDYIAAGKEDPTVDSTSEYMYERLMNEGHDARMFRFGASKDGTVKGGHTNPKNAVYWQVGCLGITSPCSSECEYSFIDCINGKDTSSSANRTSSFDDCISEDSFVNLMGCTKSCAPTYDMLKESEEPVISKFLFFGNEQNPQHARPSFSKCTAS